MSKSAKLVFKVSDVKRIVEHSVNAAEQNPIAYTGEPVSKPAIVIVHDMGVYLMSNGTPADLDNEPDDHVTKAFCAYAKGCDPVKDADYWDTSRDLVGGDDFAETLEIAEDILAFITLNPRKRVIQIEMTEDSWKIHI